MMRTVVWTGLALALPVSLLCVRSFGGVGTMGVEQDVDTQTAFDVASIKVSTSFRQGGGSETSPGRYTITNRNIRYLIRDAFLLKNYQIVGAPAWIDLDNYDVEGKASYAASRKELKIMLQALLCDRFHLKFHRATTEVKGCALGLAKGGPKFHEFPNTAERNPAKVGVLMRTGSISGAVGMAYLADYVAEALGVPVIDETGLNGTYDISLSYFTDSKLPDDPALVPESLPSALESQLGLKLGTRKIPVESFVIDHIERPTAN
jgi:uncharacterized protein (TIGR03435 family)